MERRAGRARGPHPARRGTNCSASLGALAAARLVTRWDCVVTAEQAGFYKPDPHPYRLALATLGVAPQDAAFVAGSGYDLIGTAAVGLRTYWHNRVGLARPAGATPPAIESPTLDALIPWLEGGCCDEYSMELNPR